MSSGQAGTGVSGPEKLGGWGRQPLIAIAQTGVLAPEQLWGVLPSPSLGSSFQLEGTPQGWLWGVVGVSGGCLALRPWLCRCPSTPRTLSICMGTVLMKLGLSPVALSGDQPFPGRSSSNPLGARLPDGRGIV